MRRAPEPSDPANDPVPDPATDPAAGPGGAAFRFDLAEANGALGDLGTLLPLMLAAVALTGLSAAPVLAGLAAFYLVTGLVYRLPVPVQPMKAIVAVLLVADVAPPAIAAAGVIVGLALIGLGATGLIDRIGRLVPQSVLAGLQLGLGLGLGWIAVGLMAGAAWLGALSLGLAALLLWRGRHAALAVLAAGVAMGAGFGLPGLALPPEASGWALPGWPAAADWRVALADLALPQLALTLTNAVLLTAVLARDAWGAAAARVTPRRLCLTSGAANLLLAPLGALPMCHGAGGVAAHRRFGARSGGAPVLLGLALGALALAPADLRAAILGAVPAATLGALLLVAAADLALSRRLYDGLPSCRPVIAATAVATVLAGPLAGLLAGTVAELLRRAILRRLRPAAAGRAPR